MTLASPTLGFSYYASATSLSPRFYQGLLDRCWRRSGTLLYRPNPKNSCCPHYTLRLDSAAFKPSRDQRQAINRFNRYVTGDDYARAAARLHPRPREEARKRDTVFNLVERLHEAESDALKTPPEPAHGFSITLEEDTFTEEKYQVFENYQRLVHQEPPSKISPKGFKRFLCSSPVRRETIVGADGRERQLGSFHQCYRLDGKLVAIGVLDLLPDCVSAVYFLYHESIHSFSPGKLGALREIALAIEGGYRWWYSGYYIHSCPKMRYKIDYAPQYVLDPESLAWDLLDKDLLALFDKKHYVSVAREKRKARAAQEREQGPPAEKGQPSNEDGMDATGEAASDESDEPDGEEQALMTSNFPGLMGLDELETIDLDDIPLRLDSGVYRTRNLTMWQGYTIYDWSSIKGKVAELVAAIGPDLMHEMCLDFRRDD